VIDPWSSATTVASTVAKRVMSQKTRELLNRFSADARLSEALAEEREQILWTMHAVMIAVAKALTGEELDGEQAVCRLLALANGESGSRRRFLRYWRQLEMSSDDRVAMLTTALVTGSMSVAREGTPQPTHSEGARATEAAPAGPKHSGRASSDAAPGSTTPVEDSMRERLDWLVLGLFPEDAETIQSIVRLVDIHGRLRIEASENRTYLEAVPVLNYSPNDDGDTEDDVETVGVDVSPESFNALASFGVIKTYTLEAYPSGMRGNPHFAPPTYHGVQVLRSGRALNSVLNVIDWREIARARGRVMGQS